MYCARLRARDDGDDEVDVEIEARPNLGDVIQREGDGTTRFRIVHQTLVHGRPAILDVRRTIGSSALAAGRWHFPKGQDIGSI